MRVHYIIYQQYDRKSKSTVITINDITSISLKSPLLEAGLHVHYFSFFVKERRKYGQKVNR